MSPKTQESILDEFLKRNKNRHLVDIYKESQKHFARYKNIDEGFRSNASRKALVGSHRITRTNHITAIFEEEPTQDVVNNKSLNFEYLCREISPVRTTHARTASGKSGKASGIGGIDFVARNLRYDFPVLGEIKVNRDQTPFFALIQLLTYLSEMSTRNQRKRIKKYQLFTDEVSSDAPFFLYILTCHTLKMPSHWGRNLEKSKLMAGRLKRKLPDDIRDVVFLKMSPRTHTIRTHR